MADENTINDSNAPTGEAYDSSISNTSETPETPSTEKFMGFSGYGTGVLTDQSSTEQEVGHLFGTVQNVLSADAYKNAAIAQGPLESIGNGLARGIFGEIIGGTLAGFGALGNLLADGEYNDRNWLERVGNSMMEGANEEFQIYEREPGKAFAFGDAAWWGKNLPSMMSTISLMIPGMAVGKIAAKGGAALGKGLAKTGKLLGAAADVEKAAKFGAAGGNTIGGALAMRHGENMREAHGAFETARADFMGTAGSHLSFKGTKAWRDFVKAEGRQPQNKAELADYIGGAAAYRAYQVNSANLAFDLIQMHALGKIMKGTRGKWTGRKAAKAAGQSKASVRWATVGDLSKFAVMDMGTEGIEEAVNFVGTEEGLYHAKRMYNGAEAKDLNSRMDGYLGDDHLWESAFLGALGGAVFTGAGNVAARIKNGKNESEAIDKMAERGKEAADLMGKATAAENGEVSPEEAGISRRKAMYDIGVRAAREGASDIAEMQVDTYAQTLRNEGMSEADIAEQTAEMRAEIAAAEEAVAEANAAAQGAGLTGMEAEMLKKAIIDNSFAGKEVAARREALASEIEGIENKDEQVQAIEAQLLEDITNAIALAEAMGQPVPAEVTARKEALEKRVAKHTPVPNVVNDADVAAAEETRAQAEQELAEADAKVAELQSKDPSSMTEGAKSQLAEELTEAYVTQKEAQDRVAKAKEDVATAEEGVAAPAPKINSNLAEDVELEIYQETLTGNRQRMTTEEGIKEFKDLAKVVEERLEKAEQAQFEKALKETTNEKELQAMLRKEKDAKRKEMIEDRIKQLKAEENNPPAAKDEEVTRSKDVVVSQAAQEVVDQLMENSDNVALDEDGKYYVDKRTGKKYMRTTSWMNGDKKITMDEKWGIPSSNIGNSVDEYVRDFFDGNLRQPEAYPHLPAELQKALAVQLAELEATFVANGEKVIAKDVVLFNDMEVSDDNASGVAGTVDLITVDKNGNFRIYDMKTIRDAAAKKKVISIEGGMAIYGKGDTGYNGGDTLQVKHQKQLSAYRLLLMNQFGVQVPELGIIPIDVMYNTKDGLTVAEYTAIVTSRAKYLGMIDHKALTELNGLTEPDDQVIPEDTVDETLPDDVPQDNGPAPKDTERIAELKAEIAKHDARVKKYEDKGEPNNIAANVSRKIAAKLRAELEQLEEGVLPEEEETTDETPQDPAVTTVELGENEVTFPLISLLDYFAGRLQVTEEPGREGMGYLVHTARGPVRIGDAETAAKYRAVMGAASGKPANITFEVVGVGESVDEVVIDSGMELTEAGAGLLEGSKKEKQWKYRAGKGDSLKIVMKIDGIEIGEIPTAASMMQAAHDRGLANMFTKREGKFGTESRKGKPALEENSMMTEAGTQQHVENAVAMHAFRQKMFEAHKGGMTIANVAVTASETGFGQTAQGGLIFSSEPIFANETHESIGETIRAKGFALQLPTPDKNRMQLERSGETPGLTVPPYQQGEERGKRSRTDNRVGRYNSGSLFVPVNNNGQIIYVKVPGQTISQLRNGEEITKLVVDALNGTSDSDITELQNILGNNALRMTEEGEWAIFPSNISHRAEAPLSVKRDGKWSVPVEEIVPNMNFDIGVSVAGGANFRRPDLPLTVGVKQWENITEFIIDQVNLGYAPVMDANNDVMGWTHPLAPAYPSNDARDSKNFTNENTHATQLRLTAEAVSPEVTEVEIPKPEEKEVILELQGTTEELEAKRKTVNAQLQRTDYVTDGDTYKRLKAEVAALDEAIKAAKKPSTSNDSWMDEDTSGYDGLFLKPEVAAAANNTRLSEQATAEEQAEAEAWLQENLPGVQFRRVKGLIERNGTLGYGIFEKGAIEVADVAVVGTEFHEAFHAVQEMFLAPKRNEKVMAEAAKRFGLDAVKDEVKIKEKLAEEFREYMLTDGKSMNSKTTVGRFFSELLALIKSLFEGKFQAMRLYQSINAGKFKNEVSDRTKQYATRNMLIMEQIPEYGPNEQAELTQALKGGAFRALRAAQNGTASPNVMKQYEELKRVSALDSGEFGRQNIEGEFAGMTRSEVQTNILVKMGMNSLMASAKAVMANSPENSQIRQRFSDLFTTNRDQVIKFMVERPEVRTHMSMLMDQEFTAGTDTNEQYDETFERMNPKDSLSQTVKALIETTPTMTRELYDKSAEIRDILAAAQIAIQEGDMAKARKALAVVKKRVAGAASSTFFGFPQTMQVDKVFPYMSEQLSHLTTPAEMMARLHDMGKMYPEFALLSLRLQQEPAWVQSQFFAAFHKGSTAEMVVEQQRVYDPATKSSDSQLGLKTSDVFEGSLFSHAKRNVMVALRDLAAERGVTEAQMAANVAAGVANLVSTGRYKEMSDEQFVKIASNVFDSIGFTTLDPQARERVLVMNAGKDEFREQILTIVAATAAKAGAIISDKTGENRQAEREFNRSIVLLTEKFRPYDMGAVSTTFNNVEGSRVFGKQVPSFITEWFDQFRKGDLTVQQLRNKLIRDVFVDPRMELTTFGAILFPEGVEGKFNVRAITDGVFRTVRVGGKDAAGGITYTNMSDAQWLELQLAALNTAKSGIAYMPITTPSDASNSYLIPTTVLDPSDSANMFKVKRQLANLIRAEVIELQVRPGRFANEAVNTFMRDKVQRNDKNDTFFSIKDATVTTEIIDAAADILLADLMQKGQALAKTPAFRKASESMGSNFNAENQGVALAITGYASNLSYAIGLAGTHNEFKNSKGELAQTVDMQKRHKHTISPKISPSGLSGRTHFRSVTMSETIVDLQKLNSELPDAYGKVEVADAQSYVTPEFYKDLLLEHGDLTPEKEAAIDKAIAGEKLDAAEVKLLRPYKPFYYARVFNEETGLFESQQIKNSIVPVIPGLSAEFDKLHKWMHTDGVDVDQIQMGTAHKVGHTKPDTNLLNAEGKFEVTDFSEANVYTLPMNGYGKQVNVTDHWHSDSTNKLASQLEKIVVATAVRNMGDRGIEISDEFLGAMDSIYREQMEKFFGQFETQADIVDYLVAQLDDGTTPAYVIELVKDGMFTAPSVLGAVRSRIFTGVQNEVNTIRVKGGTQVQVASQFFRTRANRLRGMRTENGKVMPAEIAVSRDMLPAQYRDMSIEEIKAAAPDVLKAITLRIPSEGMNSGAVVEVVEFLPEGFDGVIVPDEFVTQMGSDFDVDKLFFQFKEGDKGNKDLLFDLQVEVFEDPRNIKEILEPQGFDQYSELAERRGLRTTEEIKALANNPMDVLSHLSMRGDNMSGVALKGQAANKNIILLDLIRYGYSFEAKSFKINGKKVALEAMQLNYETVRHHASAVAAAMDGAKDPVYGKLGINNKNFGLFMEVLAMSGGNLELATDVIQSKAVQLESNGHIRIMPKKNDVEVVALTNEGREYINRLNNAVEKPQVIKNDTINVNFNPNFFEGKTKTASQERFMVGAVGLWKKEISRNMDYVNTLMRNDKMNVAKDIEKHVLRNGNPDKANYGDFRKAGATNKELAEGFGRVNLGDARWEKELPVKGAMIEMVEKTTKLLAEMGDGFLEAKGIWKESKFGQSMTMQQWDAHRRQEAAEEFRSEETYTAMGERETQSPLALPEDRSDWSLENWLRYIRTDKDMMANPDVALVVSKLLVQTNPYSAQGKYFDNITLVGVNDEGELKAVSDAMDRLEGDNNVDIFEFVGAIQAYEAQRSIYGMSQGRLTRILPSRVQREIATAAGAAGVNDIVSNPVAVVQMDIYNPNIPFLASEEGLEDSLALASKLGKAIVYKTTDNMVLVPVGEDETNTLIFAAHESPNEGAKFAGKQTDVAFGIEWNMEDMDNQSEDGASYDSRMGWYKQDGDIDTKVQFLKDRFKRSGLVVQVILDSSLPVNGRVKIENGGAVIRINPDLLQGDTIAHEFGHVLLEALGYNHPLVQQGIEELRGTDLWAEVAEAYPDLNDRDLGMEVLVTAIGREGEMLYRNQPTPNRFKTLLNKIYRAIGKLFGIQPKATKQLAQELMFGQGELSLQDTLDTIQEQRTKGKATKDAKELIEFAKDQLSKDLRNLRARRGTSVEAEQIVEKAEERFNAVAYGTFEARIQNLESAAREVVGQADEMTDTLTENQDVFKSGTTISSREAVMLGRADQALSDVESLLSILETIQLPKDAEDTPLAEAFAKLPEQLDSLRETKLQLQAAVANTLGNKLAASSTNKKMLETMEAEGLSIFDLVQSESLRHLMTDVGGLTKGTLGVKEFKNPVIQAIAKLTANTLEAARLDAKSDQARLKAVLSKHGVSLKDLMDGEGGFLAEVKSSYWAAREEAKEKARIEKNPAILTQWLSENTIQEYVKEYYTEWKIQNERITAVQAEIALINRQLTTKGRRIAGFQEKVDKRAALRVELQELMQNASTSFEKFHNTEFENAEDKAKFEADLMEASTRSQEAKAAKEAGEEVSNEDLFALANFRRENAVIKLSDGREVPLAGTYNYNPAVKESMQNGAFTGEAGDAIPVAKWKNDAFTAAPANIKAALTEVREIMQDVVGQEGAELMRRNAFPVYQSSTDKTTRERFDAQKKKLQATISNVRSTFQQKQEARKELAKLKNEVTTDARGNVIYLRNSAVFSANRSEEQIDLINGHSNEVLEKSLLEFVKDAHAERAKRTIEPMAYLTREQFDRTEIIDGRHVLKGKERESATKMAKGTNIATALDQWFEGVIGDNWEDTTGMDSAVGQIQKYTSLMGVGLNIPAWINNYGYGRLQRKLEFMGNHEFSKENSKAASKLMNSNWGSIVADLWKGNKTDFKNKASALIHTLDVADDQRELPFNMKESAAEQWMNRAYLGQTLGEIAMQNQVLFAMMLETQVELADGTMTTLYDAYQFDSKNGLRLPEGAQVVNKDGSKVALDNNFMAGFRNKVKSLNHHIHGAYNKQDAGTWQRHWLGRLGMQFRRWLPMGVKKRFGERQYNESREREEIGDYRALVEVYNFMADNAANLPSLKARIQALKEADPAAYRGAMRAIREMAIGAALFLTLTALYALGVDDDEDMNPLAALALNRGERLQQEMFTYTPFGMVELFNQVTEDPLASLTRVSGAYDMVGYAMGDSYRMVTGEPIARYTSGYKKGQSKLTRSVVGMIPGSSHWQRLMDLENNTREYSLTRALGAG